MIKTQITVTCDMCHEQIAEFHGGGEGEVFNPRNYAIDSVFTCDGRTYVIRAHLCHRCALLRLNAILDNLPVKDKHLEFGPFIRETGPLKLG